MRVQNFECTFENLFRQVRTVAVECNRSQLKISSEVRKHRSETRGETFTFLSHHFCSRACLLRELVHVKVGTHDGDIHIAKRLRQSQRVVEKATIKCSGIAL